MERTNDWKLNIRPYDPSEPPKHCPITNEYSGFTLTSKDVSKHQNFIKFIAKMTKKLISSGFNALNLTLPAVMLKNMSCAEIILNGYGSLSQFVSEAVKVTDPVQRMRLILAGLVSNMALVPMIMEANPPYPNFLGGTIQGAAANGIKGYVEQAGKDNTDNRLLIVGEGFKIYTYCLSMVKARGINPNNMKAGQPKPVFIEFDDGTKYEYSSAQL
jgi:hypothetical protein